MFDLQKLNDVYVIPVSTFCVCFQNVIKLFKDGRLDIAHKEHRGVLFNAKGYICRKKQIAIKFDIKTISHVLKPRRYLTNVLNPKMFKLHMTDF